MEYLFKKNQNREKLEILSLSISAKYRILKLRLIKMKESKQRNCLTVLVKFTMNFHPKSWAFYRVQSSMTLSIIDKQNRMSKPSFQSKKLIVLGNFLTTKNHSSSQITGCSGSVLFGIQMAIDLECKDDRYFTKLSVIFEFFIRIKNVKLD